MKAVKRIEQQVQVIKELSNELRYESSYRGLERLVQLIIQTLLDLALMVLSALGSSPTGYSEVATSLHKYGLLSQEEAKLVRAMAGLRNVLVHAYIGVNREILSENSKKLPDDAVKLAEKILLSAKQKLHDPPKKSPLAKTLKKVLKNRVKIGFIFGSQVKGYTFKGDVDIAVFFGKKPDPYEVGALVFDIQEALGREDVDVLVLDACENLFMAYEAVQGEPIIGDPVDVLELKTKIISQYIDYREKLGYIEALHKT